jgi:hypothetical protein
VFVNRVATCLSSPSPVAPVLQIRFRLSVKIFVCASAVLSRIGVLVIEELQQVSQE